MIPDSVFFVLAHNIRSLHNVGSFFRTSDVFGVSKLFLTGYTGHPPDPRLGKVALGAELTVPWEYNKSPVRLIKKLKTQYPGLSIVGLENNVANTVSLQSFIPEGPILLILGEEVKGLPKNVRTLCNIFVEIPQFGTKESLNVSVAFGIAACHIGTAIHKK